MEPHSRTDDTNEARAILEGQLRESYGRVVYSHKTHETCADILLLRHDRIRLAQIVLSAITTAGFVGAAMGTGREAAIAGAVLAAILLVLNSYTKKYDLGELAQKHRQAGSDLHFGRRQWVFAEVKRDDRVHSEQAAALQFLQALFPKNAAVFVALVCERQAGVKRPR